MRPLTKHNFAAKLTGYRKRLHLLAWGMVAGLMVSNSNAADDPLATTQTLDADLKELNDPTILGRRVSFEHEWNRFEDGSNVFEDTLSGQWAWRLSANADWAVRLKLRP